MQISELMEKGKPRKGLKLKVRVPSTLQEKLGSEANGEFVGLKRDGRVVTVNVTIKGKKYGFRPQDVSKA